MNLRHELILAIEKYLPLWFAIMLPWILGVILIAIYVAPPQEIEERILNTAKELRTIFANKSFHELVLMILLNNAFINSMLLIPFLNIIIAIEMTLQTAWVLRMFLVINNIDLYTAYTLLLMPHTYIEFLAYTIAFTTSLRIMFNLFRRRKFEKIYILINIILILLSYLLLSISSIIETIGI